MSYDIGHEPPLEPPEGTPKYWCGDCGEPIYEGEFYYDIDDKIICEKCIDDFIFIA